MVVTCCEALAPMVPERRSHAVRIRGDRAVGCLHRVESLGLARSEGLQCFQIYERSFFRTMMNPTMA